MNRHHAEELVERLVNLTTGWTPESILELTKELESWRDTECAEAAVDYVAHYWAERSRPPLGWIVRAYNVEMDAKRRDMELTAPPEVYPVGVPPAQGREAAFQTYRESLHLPDDVETRSRLNEGGVGAWPTFVDVAAPEDEQHRALVAVGSGTMYATVLKVFGGDHLRAGRALRTLVKRGAVVHGNDGWITVRYPSAD